MRVYRIRGNVGYDKLEPIDHPGLDGMFCGKLLGLQWQEMPVKRKQRRLGPFDLQIFLNPSGLIMTSRANEKLMHVLRPAEVELLSLVAEGNTFKIANVINVIDCLDNTKTVFSSPDIPEYYEFNLEKISGILFKRPNDLEILVPEWREDPATEFRAAVIAAGLKGIEFDLLWES